MELEQAFRMMALELTTKLSEKDCHNIAYVACIEKIIPPEHGNDFRLYLLNTLESRGQIGPLKLQFLEEILVAEPIGRNDLLEVISKYKKKPIYKKAEKKSLRKEKKIKRERCHVQQAAVNVSPNTVHQYEKIYATFLTQFSQMALSMRSAIETGEIAKMKDAFSSVVSSGDAVTRALRKNLSLAGVNSDSLCTSSSGDSSRMVSPISTPPRARIEVSNDATTLESEESSSDQHPRRESTQAIASVQPHCQVSQSHLPSIPVYVYHESPSISQRLSQIDASNSDDVEDAGDGNRTPSDSVSGDIDVCQTADGYDPKFDDTETGTGDSGVARDIMQHTPSKEFLDQIDPDHKEDPSEDVVLLLVAYVIIYFYALLLLFGTNIISPHDDITVFEAHHINLLAVDMETRHVGEPLCKFSYVI